MSDTLNFGSPDFVIRIGDICEVLDGAQILITVRNRNPDDRDKWYVSCGVGHAAQWNENGTPLDATQPIVKIIGGITR